MSSAALFASAIASLKLSATATMSITLPPLFTNTPSLILVPACRISTPSALASSRPVISKPLYSALIGSGYGPVTSVTVTDLSGGMAHLPADILCVFRVRGIESHATSHLALIPIESLLVINTDQHFCEFFPVGKERPAHLFALWSTEEFFDHQLQTCVRVSLFDCPVDHDFLNRRPGFFPAVSNDHSFAFCQTSGFDHQCFDPLYKEPVINDGKGLLRVFSDFKVSSRDSVLSEKPFG